MPQSIEELRHWRDGPWYWVTVVCIILAIASLVSYEIWVRESLSELPDRDIYEVSVVKLFCNKEHFWGQEINFTYHGDGIRRYGVMCRDWINRKWEPDK